MFACFFCPQDKNGTIENEELNGFLKDLMELVQQVGQSFLSECVNIGKKIC